MLARFAVPGVLVCSLLAGCALAHERGAPPDPSPIDAHVAVDAGPRPDAFALPDAFVVPDAFALPDAFVVPDAFVPDAWRPVDAGTCELVGTFRAESPGSAPFFTTFDGAGHWGSSNTLGGPFAIDGAYVIVGDRITFTTSSCDATYQLTRTSCDAFRLDFLSATCGEAAFLTYTRAA